MKHDRANLLTFVFTLELDFGAVARVARIPGKTEALALQRARQCLTTDEQAQLRSVRVLAIDYYEGTK